ncbi:band 7 protein AGAP004871 isoform X1 [Daphnia magna]|uniref:band 7 protein AGAP004871 isoform X1 n=1 Tax=Daphnia magna TaxID=35525 RepID=UPI001E1BDAFC|nr:band 7 protein AGAP004871 isoform X1 [Daphnia magna]
MGPIDPEGGDMKAIVAGSPSSGSSSLNMTSPVVIVPAIDERPTVTTITVTGVDGTLQNNGEASSTTPAVQTPVVACAQPCGYSSAYVTNRMHNTQLGADPGGPGICAFILTLFSFLLILATFPLSLCFSVKVVQEYERAVIFRLGRLLKGGARGPGIFFIVPCIDTYRKVDLRTVSFDVPPQEILSRDSVTVAVDAVVYYRVQNPTIAVSNVENFSHSTRLLAATTLRNVLGTKNLAEILSERETISHTMQSSLDEATDPWGVKVERVEIKDVRLPVQLQRAMAAEAEAAREARAKVIAAEGEQKASRALRDAAEVIAESPAALQLRYLQTLNTISAEKNSTIIFPLPIDILKHFIKPSKVDKYDL